MLLDKIRFDGGIHVLSQFLTMCLFRGFVFARSCLSPFNLWTSTTWRAILNCQLHLQRILSLQRLFFGNDGAQALPYRLIPTDFGLPSQRVTCLLHRRFHILDAVKNAIDSFPFVRRVLQADHGISYIHFVDYNKSQHCHLDRPVGVAAPFGLDWEGYQLEFTTKETVFRFSCKDVRVRHATTFAFSHSGS